MLNASKLALRKTGSKDIPSSLMLTNVQICLPVGFCLYNSGQGCQTAPLQMLIINHNAHHAELLATMAGTDGS